MPKGMKEAKNVPPARRVAKSARLLYNVAEMKLFLSEGRLYHVP